jgi:beta-mannosidase
VEGQHATNNSPNGDIHYWGVWHGKEPFSAFYDNIGRFMSEYGFQSFPEFETVKKYTLPSDWDIESEVMSAHQRSGIGNLRIRSYMKDHYQVPRKFEDMLYIGQLLQAEGIKMAIEAHRSAKPYCMGTLYWQLNDCWPVASWSGMDYYQNWKAMHYFVKKAYAPVMLAFRCESGKLKLQAVSDRQERLDATLQLELLDFSGKSLWKEDTNIKLGADVSEQVGEWSEKMLTKKGNARKMVLRARLVEKGKIIASDLYYFKEVKKLHLPRKLVIETSVTRLADGALQIGVKSDQLAKNVFLKIAGTPGFFSDNYFDLLPGETVEVIFKPVTKGADMQAVELVIKTVGGL